MKIVLWTMNHDHTLMMMVESGMRQSRGNPRSEHLAYHHHQNKSVVWTIHPTNLLWYHTDCSTFFSVMIRIKMQQISKSLTYYLFGIFRGTLSPSTSPCIYLHGLDSSMESWKKEKNIINGKTGLPLFCSIHHTTKLVIWWRLYHCRKTANWICRSIR